MQTASLPLMRGPDHTLTCGGLPSGTADALTLGICSHGQLVIIVLGGELDIATAPGLARRLGPLAEIGSHLILDLAAVRFCDCAGLRRWCSSGEAMGRSSAASMPWPGWALSLLSCRSARRISWRGTCRSPATSPRRCGSGCMGKRRALDTGSVNGEHVAVMAGAGFDASMMKQADGDEGPVRPRRIPPLTC
jgi:STAS domain